MKVKAVVMFSGGLDSILAVRVLQEQGIEVHAFNMQLDFLPGIPGEPDAVDRAAQMLGAPLKRVYSPADCLNMLKHPRHGYGKNMNPCLDCKVLIMRKAAEYMAEIGASFVATGEVLGERPMSQRREAMAMIEKEAGLQRMVVRPLSAQLLEPTIPEETGLVDRSRLLAIHGRSRKPQMELAAKYGISEYPHPAGGCLLTDPGFSRRLVALMKERPNFDSNDLNLLKFGRHFRVGPGMVAVVGRDDADNNRIVSLARTGDALMEATEFAGPATLCRGPMTDDALRKAGAITARYGKGHAEAQVEIRCRRVGESSEPFSFRVAPREHDEVGADRIG